MKLADLFKFKPDLSMFRLSDGIESEIPIQKIRFTDVGLGSDGK